MDEITKAIQANRLGVQDNIDSISKGKAVPVGTVRARPNGNFIKTAMGWKYHSSKSKSAKVSTAAKEASNNYTSEDNQGFKVKVGDRTKIHPQLTTDPKSKQGQVGEITKISKDGDITVKFGDGVIGLYGSGTFMKTSQSIKVPQSKTANYPSPKVNQVGMLGKRKVKVLTFDANTVVIQDLSNFKDKLTSVGIAIWNQQFKPTNKSSSKHIGDMSKTEKQKAAEKLGIDTKGKTDAQLNKEMISANIDKQMADFKAKKDSSDFTKTHELHRQNGYNVAQNLVEKYHSKDTENQHINLAKKFYDLGEKKYKTSKKEWRSYMNLSNAHLYEAANKNSLPENFTNEDIQKRNNYLEKLKKEVRSK